MDTLIERNSTNFPKELANVLANIKNDKNAALRYHQTIVYEYVLKNPRSRGLLIYHKMGAGKTITGASLAEGLKEQDVKRRIIVMAAKSLHANFRKDVMKYKKMVAEKESGTPLSDEALNKYIDDNYQFISLNASNMITQVHKAVRKDADLSAFDDNIITADEADEFSKLDKIGNLDNSVLIIDEAHNLFNAITNGSKNAMGLYRLIMDAKNIKIIFLTGTPIVNDPFEFAVCMNMIAGPMGRHSNGSPITLFGEDYADFTKYFVGAVSMETADPKDPSKRIKVVQPTIRNRDKFINRVVGLVSYYGADDKDQSKRYPEQLETIIADIPMSPKQYAAYISARDREIEETTRGLRPGSGHKKPLQKPEGMSSSYRVRSRQFSNFLFPNYASKTFKDARGYAKYEKYLDQLKEENLRVRGSDGKGDDEANFGIEVWSPKIMKLLEHLQAHLPFKFYSDKLAPNVTKKAQKAPKKSKKTGKGEVEIIKTKTDLTKFYVDIFEDVPDFNMDDPDIVSWVAKSGDDVTGFAVIKPNHSSSNKRRSGVNYLLSLGVIKKHRGQGIATQLLNTILSKYPVMYLKVNRKHTIAKKFYEKSGFFVYRASPDHWYMRRISGGVPEMKSKGGLGPGLIYSQFIDAGVGLMGKVLSAHGFKEIKNLDDALKHQKGASFAIISGDVDPDLRAEIVRIFNSPENKHGEHLSVLLVTSTGAEGLDLKCVRHIHILEPYWHWARIAQVLARGVRMDSHITLPEKERNVQPYIYLSDYPGIDKLKELSEELDEGLDHIKKQMEKEDTTDVTLYEKSVANQVMIDTFLKAIQEASIDCSAHYKGKLDCRLCAPTGEHLFVPDLDKDMKTRSPCEPLTEGTVKAKTITITVGDEKIEKDFAYVVKEGKAHIFEFDPKLGAHSEIFEDHEYYDDVYAAIKKKEKMK